MRKLIYLVEDNEEISDLIEYIVAESGFDIKAFTNIFDFKRSLTENFPALILLDIMLPDGDGIEICRELKSNLQTAHIPIILMSAHINIQTRAFAAGADDFIDKPFDIDEFVEKIKKHVLPT